MTLATAFLDVDSNKPTVWFQTYFYLDIDVLNNMLFEFILFKPFCLTITNKRPYITYRRTQQTNNYVILTEKHNTINNYLNTLFNYFSSNNIAKKKQNERSIRKHATSNRE